MATSVSLEPMPRAQRNAEEPSEIDVLIDSKGVETSVPSDDRDNSVASARKAMAVTCFWLTMSCCQILFNKLLFSNSFRFPVTLTAVHMTFASIATSVLRIAGVIEVAPLPGGLPFFLRAIVPISCLFATALGCGNVAAARLSVGFVHILKAITPVVVLGVGIVLGVSKPCIKQGAVVSIISSGVILASLGEIGWDSLGFILQLIAVVAESTRLVLMQKLLQQHMPKASPIATLSLFAPLSAVILSVLSTVLEPNGFHALVDAHTAKLVALNTASAFTLNIAVMLLVATTSGLTLVLAGIVKDMIVIVASMFIFRNPMAPIQCLGYLVALFGLSLQDTYKKDESKAMVDMVKATAWSARMLVILVSVAALAALPYLVSPEGGAPVA